MDVHCLPLQWTLVQQGQPQEFAHRLEFNVQCLIVPAIELCVWKRIAKVIGKHSIA